jgi:hypothetical protein
MGIAAECNGVLVGVEELRKCVLCFKQEVPRYKIQLQECTRMSELNRSTYLAKLEVYQGGLRDLEHKLAQSETEQIKDAFIWGSVGATIGLVIGMLVN